jgi:hypothetical protein
MGPGHPEGPARLADGPAPRGVVQHGQASVIEISAGVTVMVSMGLWKEPQSPSPDPTRWGTRNLDPGQEGLVQLRDAPRRWAPDRADRMLARRDMPLPLRAAQVRLLPRRIVERGACRQRRSPSGGRPHLEVMSCQPVPSPSMSVTGCARTRRRKLVPSSGRPQRRPAGRPQLPDERGRSLPRTSWSGRRLPGRRRRWWSLLPHRESSELRPYSTCQCRRCGDSNARSTLEINAPVGRRPSRESCHVRLVGRSPRSRCRAAGPRTSQSRLVGLASGRLAELHQRRLDRQERCADGSCGSSEVVRPPGVVSLPALAFSDHAQKEVFERKRSAPRRSDSLTARPAMISARGVGDGPMGLGPGS